MVLPRAAVNTRVSTKSSPIDHVAGAAPPQLWFGVSAVSHYLGPAFAVLLFPAIGVMGVAWLRIATAALFFTALKNPFATFRQASSYVRWLLLAFGVCLAAMNTAFYLALERLPLSLVAAMEFVGTLAIALVGMRTCRNVISLALAVIGVVILMDVVWADQPLGLLFCVINAALFALYIVLGHKAAESGAQSGIHTLGAAMLLALILVTPGGIREAFAAFHTWPLLLAGIGVGIASSVIPYVCDQLAMSRLPRASFAFYLAALPAIAAIVGAAVLAQIPTRADVLGIALVVVGVTLHQPSAAPSEG